MQAVSVPVDCFFTIANSADPDEMLPYAAFHLVFTVYTGIQDEGYFFPCRLFLS